MSNGAADWLPSSSSGKLIDVAPLAMLKALATPVAEVNWYVPLNPAPAGATIDRNTDATISTATSARLAPTPHDDIRRSTIYPLTVNGATSTGHHPVTPLVLVGLARV